MSQYRRILVPVDGSDPAGRALTTALQFARDHDGQVCLLHAIDELAWVSVHEYSTEMLQAARDNARRVLAEAQAMAQAAGVPAETTLLDKPAQRLGETVAEVARDWKADLIVLGSHGRHGLPRLLLGSGAEQIMRLAPVPVLVVRAEA